MRYYNPATRPNVAKTTLYVTGPIDSFDRFYNLKETQAYKSREAVLARDFSGPACWFEDGKLMEGSSVGSFEFKPLIEEPSFDNGINWNDAFFFTREAAQAWADNCGCRTDGVQYSEAYDVYSVHFHWIDNPDCMRFSYDKPLDNPTQSGVFSKMKKMSLE